MIDLALVAGAAAFAGFVDAIVGGGGLILVPALFALYPGAAPATLLGTNKGGSVWGTAWATVQYARRVTLNWRALTPAVTAALAGSLAGAWSVTQVDAEGLKRALPFVTIGALVGFYDGFFGPGTGSFFVFLFVRVLGYDFLHASASAKLLNTATNASALVLFAAQGHVWWHVALVAALANVAGSTLGARLALRHGAGFVRGVFIVVVGALIVKTGYDAFFR
jgi:uncharacterized membrane protein YfcA